MLERQRVARRTAAAIVALSFCFGVPGPRAAALAAEQVSPAPARPCALSWVGHEGEIEDYLRTAPIARMEKLPIGVTKPMRAYFEPGGMVESFAWKQLPPGPRRGFWESYKAEIAAYELDKLLGMHMVPPAVERRIDGELGAAVFWIADVSGWDMDHPVKGPEPEWSRQVSRMKLFDQLIANIDRNEGNLLYDSDWHLFLIDHSRAFTNRRDLKGMRQPEHIDKGLWDKIDTLTLGDLQKALSAWVARKELDAILVRRESMRQVIGRMVAQRGEANVFLK